MNEQDRIRTMLFDYMEENEVTLKYVSNLSGLSYNLLSRFKNEKVDLEYETLISLEMFLEIIQQD